MSKTDLQVTRLRHEIKQRTLQVRRVESLTPAMLRVTVGGDDLEGFYSPSFDDHVKLFVPSASGEKPLFPKRGPNGERLPDQEVSVARDYTPRNYNPDAQELDLDFVLHASGYATNWAKKAKPGDYLGVGGPRGSFVVPTEFDWHVLIGDKTTIPAIARRLAELPADKKVIALIETRMAAARVEFDTKADVDLRWVLASSDTSATTALEQAARQITLADGEGFVWAAGEYSAIKAIRSYFVDELGLDKSRIRASSYWRRGADATHETF